MRIIGGEWRSRRLLRPKTDATRPMPDRVKQAIFDMLSVYFGTPGELPPLLVADLFAGSGSMGLEALSRGAKACWFYERDRNALAALTENIQALGAEAIAMVKTSDAWRAPLRTGAGGAFELVFLDPPYRDVADASPLGLVGRFLDGAAKNETSRPLLVFHHPAVTRLQLSPQSAWAIVENRTFGTNGVTFLS